MCFGHPEHVHTATKPEERKLPSTIKRTKKTKKTK